MLKLKHLHYLLHAENELSNQRKKTGFMFIFDGTKLHPKHGA